MGVLFDKKGNLTTWHVTIDVVGKHNKVLTENAWHFVKIRFFFSFRKTYRPIYFNLNNPPIPVSQSKSNLLQSI